MKQPVERRLAAILAPMCGLLAADGRARRARLERLKAHRVARFDPKDQRDRGRIVKTRGDGMLVNSRAS